MQVMSILQPMLCSMVKHVHSRRSTVEYKDIQRSNENV